MSGGKRVDDLFDLRTPWRQIRLCHAPSVPALLFSRGAEESKRRKKQTVRPWESHDGTVELSARGKRYNVEKRQDGGHGNQKSDRHFDGPTTTERLAAEYQVSPRTIKHDAKFAEAVDTLAENVEEKVCCRGRGRSWRPPRLRRRRYGVALLLHVATQLVKFVLQVPSAACKAVTSAWLHVCKVAKAVAHAGACSFPLHAVCAAFTSLVHPAGSGCCIAVTAASSALALQS